MELHGKSLVSVPQEGLAPHEEEEEKEMEESQAKFGNLCKLMEEVPDETAAISNRLCLQSVA